MKTHQTNKDKKPSSSQSPQKPTEQKMQWRDKKDTSRKEEHSEPPASDEFPNRNPESKRNPDIEMGKKHDGSSQHKSPDSRR